MLASDGGAPAPRRPAARISGLLASDGGAPAPRRPAARISGLLASDGGAPAPRRPAARISGLLASDGGAPAPRRPAARTAFWGEVRKGGGALLRVPYGVTVKRRRPMSCPEAVTTSTV